MKKPIFYISLIVLLFLSIKVQAQADISMSTHWYNRANYNPAFIARTEYLYAFFNTRQQWVGVDGSPQVYNVQVSEYIHALRSAFGVSLISDKIGASKVLNPMISYAYRISSERDWSLNLGMSGGFFNRTVDGSGYEAESLIDDPSINYGTIRNTSPDANAGVEFQNSWFIAGLSSTHLFNMTRTDEEYLNSNHRYAYLIYKNNNLEKFFYKIGVQAVNRHNATVWEANGFIRFKHATGLMEGSQEVFDLGLTVRTSRQLTFLVGVLLTPDLRVGYAYDQSFISGYYQNGTHELVIEYRIPNKAASEKFRCGSGNLWYH